MNKIYIVQHCQSEHHVNELTGGWTDTPLTELGKRQAIEVVKELKILGVNKNCILYTSDLKRANMTAKYISEYFGIDLIITKALREINNGEAANKTKKWANENQLYKSSTWEIDKPLWKNGETPRKLFNRMNSFNKEFLNDLTNDIVIVSHGIAISYLISSWLNLNTETLKTVFIQGNAGGISVLSRNCFGQNTLLKLNTTSHIREL